MKFSIILSLVSLSFWANAQIITTIAGGGTGGDGIIATSSYINTPHCIAYDKFGNLYISDNVACKIRKIDTSGVISTVAGNGSVGYGGDGTLAISAKLKYPEGIAIDTIGDLYIADRQNYRIRKVSMTTGIISTIAGDGTIGDFGDGGAASSAKLVPTDLRFDSRGNLYITDGTFHKIRKINPIGLISTFAGIGTAGFSGDGYPATNAHLSNPFSIAIDRADNIYFTDNDNKRVRKVDTSGIITTIAGTGTALYTGDGMLATNAQIGPYYVSLDKKSNIFISDSNARIRMVDTFGIIHTVVGTGILGFSGDGTPATTAQIFGASGITFDACNNLYFADAVNRRIRKVTYPPLLTIPTISLSGETNMPVGSTVTVTATVANAGSSYLIHWLNHGIEFTTTTVPMVTYTKPPGVDTITARIVPTGYGCWDSTTSAGHMVMVGTTGIPTGPAADGITIYPNPTTHLLHITGLPGAATYRLLSMVGAVARCGELPAGGGAAPLHGLPPGIYMLELVTERGERVVRRVVKE